jgi:hypothetical protein
MPSRLLPLAAAILFAAAPLAARAADTCGLLTAGEISAATGDPVTSTSPGPSNCIWRGKASGVYLTIRDGATWANGKSMFQASGHLQPSSGVGDDSFFLDAGAQPFLYVLKGGHFIILRVNVNKFSQAQNEAADKALATSAIGRM